MGASKFVGLWAIVAEAWRWPAALIAVQLQRYFGWRRAALQWAANPRIEGAAQPARALGRLVAGSLALPFETLRAQHAAAALAGAVPMSMIESARFGRALEAAERLALGPFARRR